MEFSNSFHVYSMFGSGMVVQAGKPVIVAGTAEPLKAIRVEMDDDSVVVVADSRGQWKAKLPPRQAGWVPLTMKISGAKTEDTVVFSDILVGEVWLCSGQSNMEMPVWSYDPFYRVSEYQEIFERQPQPGLRLFNARNVDNLTKLFSPFELQHENKNETGWQLGKSDSIWDFSALGYYFGSRLQTELNLPVGLIHASMGDSYIRSWISRKKLEECGENAILDVIHKAEVKSHSADIDTVPDRCQRRQEFSAWLRKFRGSAPEKTEAAVCWSLPVIDRTGWEAATLPLTIPVPAIEWLRAEFDIPDNCAGRELTLRFGTANDYDETFFNGKCIGKTQEETPSAWKKQRVYIVPGNLVHPGRNIVALRVENHYISGGISGAGGKITATSGELQLTATNLLRRTEFVADLKKIGPRPMIGEEPCCDPDNPRSHNFPTSLSNGLLNPWTQYPIRGVIWYQGCNDNGDLNYYRYQRELIEDWRERWNNPEMPFIIMQLAGYFKQMPEERGPEDRWKNEAPEELPPFALTREIQAEATKIPHVLMATAFDCGDQYDVHPRNKKTPAFRMTRLAEKYVYHMDVAARGPEFDRYEVETNGCVRVFFRFTAGGLITSDGKAPGAFALRDQFGKLHWAQAVIDGETILVHSPEVKVPVAVRYGFVAYRGDVNVYNREGFPLLPFRSDKPEYS